MKKVPEDIKELELRIQQLKEKENRVRGNKEESPFMHASKTGLRIGTELLSGVLVGAAVGYFLDQTLETKPWMLIVFLFLGGAAGILNVYRFVKKKEKSKE